MSHTDFTPIASLCGGALIGLAAVMLLALVGRIAGISGIASRLISPSSDDNVLGRAAFIGGLILAPLLIFAVTGHLPLPTIETPWVLLLPAGLLVGFGTVYGNGCTSGHGVCGLSLLSRRSAVATAVFMGAAALTVFVMRHMP